MQIVELGDCSMAISLGKHFPKDYFLKCINGRRIKVDKAENYDKYQNGWYYTKSANEFLLSGDILVLYFDEGMPDDLKVGDNVLLLTAHSIFIMD